MRDLVFLISQSAHVLLAINCWIYYLFHIYRRPTSNISGPSSFLFFQVLSKVLSGDYHIFVALNVRGTAILHWGVSKSSAGEWLVRYLVLHLVGNTCSSCALTLKFSTYGMLANLTSTHCLLSSLIFQAPPSDMLPEKSKMVVEACQTYFTEKTVGGRPFQVIYSKQLSWVLVLTNMFNWLTHLLLEKKLVDVNLQKRNFVGTQFVIWCGGSWIKNNGGNFFVALQRVLPIRKVTLLYCTRYLAFAIDVWIYKLPMHSEKVFSHQNSFLVFNEAKLLE